MTTDINELRAILMPTLRTKNPRTGRVIEFELNPHQRTFLYFLDWNGTQHCYTPHKDKEGWYYSFVYAPVGPGSRTGKAKRWKLKKLRCHRTRKAAKARALSGYNRIMKEAKP